LFLTAQFVAGVMLFSQILGNTILTILKANAEARKFRGKIDLVVAYLDMRNVISQLPLFFVFSLPIFTLFPSIDQQGNKKKSYGLFRISMDPETSDR
jgi:hypothetical protein